MQKKFRNFKRVIYSSLKSQIEKLKKRGKLEKYEKLKEIAAEKRQIAIFEQEIKKGERRQEKFKSGK